jgi:hypothetical protein
MVTPRMVEKSSKSTGQIYTKSLKHKAERVKGIEPSSSAWKAVALPLSYTRNFNNLAPIFRRF